MTTDLSRWAARRRLRRLTLDEWRRMAPHAAQTVRENGDLEHLAALLEAAGEHDLAATVRRAVEVLGPLPGDRIGYALAAWRP